MLINTNPEKYIYYMVDIFAIEPIPELIIAKDNNEVIEYYENIRENNDYDADTKFNLIFDTEKAKNDLAIYCGHIYDEDYEDINDENTKTRYLVNKITVAELNNLNCMNIMEFFYVQNQV